METKKEQANNYFSQGKFEEAVNIYSEILQEDPENYLVLSNRAAAYIKLEKFEAALIDSAYCTKLKPDWGKAWGRLGGALHGLENYDDALVAYNKANELESCELYQKAIKVIKEKLFESKAKLVNENLPDEVKNSPMGQMYTSMCDSVTDNPVLLEKLMDPGFQQKILSLRANPAEMFKDKDIMGLMMEMMKGMKFD